jgi:hypothetical protein
VALGECLKVNDDGTITALNEEGELLIEVLRLNNEDYTRFRSLILTTIRSLEKHNRGAFVLWMSYPDSLPNLKRLRPIGNSRPDGVKDSFFERRERGELEDVY